MVSPRFLRAVVVAGLMVGLPPHLGSALAEGTLILDESAYWRTWLDGGPARVSPEMMEKDGARLLKEAGLKTLEERLRAKLKKENRTADDWRRELFYSSYANLDLFNAPGVRSAPPPADWTTPGFDDRDWSRHQKPFKMAKDFYVDGIVDHFYQIRTARFRTTFEVPDPGRAGDLLLRLAYRGGARAFLNGEEIGRGHLPAGDLAPDVPAEPYPSEAYVLLDGEYPPDLKPPGHRLGVIVKPEFHIVPDMAIYQDAPEDFDALEKSKDVPGPYRRPRAIGYHGNCFLNRAGWERIMRLRNRVLEVVIPQSRVKRGTNLLALEVRSSELGPVALGWSIPWSGNLSWKHGWLLGVQVRAKGAGARVGAGGEPAGPAWALPPVLRRPPGVQVWVKDIHHRVYTPEFHPPGEFPREARIVATRNGTYSAQVVVGTERELKGLRASVTAFRGVGRASLPASIVRVFYPVAHPAWEMRALGQRKGSGEDAEPGFAEGVGDAIVERYRMTEEAAQPDKGREAVMKRVGFFDHLSSRAPEAVPADTCQPVWLSVSVPADAAAGRYRAAIRIEAAGMEPVELPLEMDVLDWRVPDPKDFQTIIAFEQSPYAIARHYKAEPWSKEHFRLMARSYELLARVGNDLLIVPVVCRTEFGNVSDSPIRVTRGRDGSVALDFTILDRYLDMAVRHWGEPRCVAFIVDYSEPQPVRLGVSDGTKGEKELLEVGKEAPEELRRRVWRVLARGIYDHMKSRGMEKLVYWGLHGDGVNDPGLVKLLRELVPEVTWLRVSHQNAPDETYTFCGTIRSGGTALTTTSLKGWKCPPERINLWMPRNWNGAAVCYGTSEPFAYRLGIERALVAGLAGAARFGADYWDSTWLHGFPRCPYAGMPVVSLLWPGPQGAESSARFEMLCEGIQEVEARIFLDQAIEKLADPEIQREVTGLLDQRIHDTLFALVFAPHAKLEEYSSGWQARSRRLYEMAARVAARIGVDFAGSALRVNVAARGKTPLKVPLRNWAAQARGWKLAADQPWLQPERATGRARPGSQDLVATLDASGLKPGETARGALCLTDLETGRGEPLEITAQVSKVFELTGPELVANVPVGGQGRLDFTLLNSSASPLHWRIAASEPWLRAEPGSGRLPTGGQCPIALAIHPPDRTRATHEAALRVVENGGAEQSERLVVHVLPEPQVRASRPAGATVPMEDLPRDSLVSCVYGGRKRDRKEGLPFHKPDRRYGYWGLCIGRTQDPQGRPKPLQEFKRGLALPPGTEVTYRIAGRKFKAFSVAVGYLADFQLGREDPRLHFEVYLDGKFAAHSGLMAPADAPRLLVVEDLGAAEEIRLVTRTHNDRLNDREVQVHGVWADPLFHE